MELNVANNLPLYIGQNQSHYYWLLKNLKIKNYNVLSFVRRPKIF